MGVREMLVQVAYWTNGALFLMVLFAFFGYKLEVLYAEDFTQPPKVKGLKKTKPKEKPKHQVDQSGS
jgi:hypothetical protein